MSKYTKVQKLLTLNKMDGILLEFYDFLAKAKINKRTGFNT